MHLNKIGIACHNIASELVLLKHHLDYVGRGDVLTEIDVVKAKVELDVENVIPLFLQGTQDTFEHGAVKAELFIYTLVLTFRIEF